MGPTVRTIIARSGAAVRPACSSSLRIGARCHAPSGFRCRIIGVGTTAKVTALWQTMPADVQRFPTLVRHRRHVRHPKQEKEVLRTRAELMHNGALQANVKERELIQ